MERRLAAILAADVVGYTRLMGEDEAGTLQRLKNLRAETLDPLIAEHHGRLVKLMGDGFLIEFASAVDAVSCAVAWQEATGDGAGAQAANGQLRFRIGINLGDVMIDGDDIYGDGVNIASRLEGLAEPGGICLSAKVYEEVRTKLDHVFDDLGAQEFKNVADPIRVYRIITGSDPAKPASQSEPKTTPREKPSIAVLPFDNMSGDPEQEFFADGITEDLITALSKIRWFFVIARNSTFSYKGQTVEVTQAAKELGVRYVLEGSVRRAGNRVRITAQLVDATTGHHVWAERYDRNIEDIFALQDEMTLTIVGAVEPELSAAERERALAKPPENLDAWETYQRGLWNMWRFQKESNAEAPDLLRRAHELDPNFATAYAHEAYAHYLNVIMGWAEDQDATLARGMKAAETALSIDDKDAIAWFALGRIQMMQGKHDASVAALERSLTINPSFAPGYHGLGMALALSGRYEEANEMLGKAELVSPRDPMLWAFLVVHAMTQILSEDYEDALYWARKTLQIPRATGYWPHAVLAAPLAHLGQMDEARAAVASALEQKPDLTLSYLAKTLPHKQPGGLEPWLEGLRKAGLPE